MAITSQQLLALFAANDLETLIDGTFPLLQSAVTCDFVSAFSRSIGSGLLKERDSKGRISTPEFMQRYVELTPALPVALANRGINVITTHATLPHSINKLRTMPIYREIMQPQGWRHAVALCFWGHPPAESPIFVTSVYRGDGQPDFSATEVAALEHAHAFLDCAVSRLHERQAAHAVQGAMAIAAQRERRAVAILDTNFALVQASPVARQLCAAWLEGERLSPQKDQSAAWRLPPALLAVCRELHLEWVSAVRVDPDESGGRHRRVLQGRNPELIASITMVCPNAHDLAEPTFVLEFDRLVHGVALDAVDAAEPLLEKLTAAERAVAMVLADGLSNQDIADQLEKPVGAVKFLLHRIYEKTGIPNRAALVAVLRGRGKASQVES